ncbi:hypothetical protein C8Q79DRAFT_978705 [Trametes meyenii]|nr:hypothetical protein C8Q79DRAFT_978705 [Trametes meyenii]
MSRLDGYSLHLTAPPSHSVIGISYPTTSLSGASSLKRKRSNESMAVTLTVEETVPPPDTPLVLPIIFPSVDRDGDEFYVSAGSPAPTEIVDDVHENDEECMEKAKAAGVKVRDFAYEPLAKPRDLRAPEVWTNPRETLVMHDRYVRTSLRRADNYRLSGKLLHRLLAINWVTQEEAEANWRPEDWKAVQEYVTRPLGAYPFCIPSGCKKPTAAYRAYMRKDKYLPLPDDLPEEKILVPADEPGMDDGPPRVDPAFLRAAVATLERALSGGASRSSATPVAPPVATPPAHAVRTGSTHVDKRRRVSGPTLSPAASAAPQDTPPASPIRASGRTLSRSASFSASSSRASTPPVAHIPPRLARGRGLARTQTLDIIA